MLLNIRTGAEVPVYCSYTPLFHEGEIEGCFVYMIPKSEHDSMVIPPNVTTLLEALNKQLLLLRPHSVLISNPLDNIIGDSPQILKTKDEIICAARSSSTVLIEGETGSGKELVAHAIHELSMRQNHRLVKVNCAAIPSELLEAEFFGYEEGSFTGARRGGQAGKFEVANNGSLFLDDINQMPFSLQPTLEGPAQNRIHIARVVHPIRPAHLDHLAADRKNTGRAFNRTNHLRHKYSAETIGAGGEVPQRPLFSAECH